MASKPRILVICGTRPDAIKAAPVVLELRKFDAAETILVSTGQHREMLRQSLETFGLKADIDLAIMTHGQSLAEVTCKALEGLDELIDRYRPAWVLAQGDTTTTFTASLAAFYRQIPFGHIEAGLRTDSITDPFPEEFNRRTTAQLAGLHFAPTAWSAANLRKERHTAENIYITGNTGIDALHLAAHGHTALAADAAATVVNHRLRAVVGFQVLPAFRVAEADLLEADRIGHRE